MLTFFGVGLLFAIFIGFAVYAMGDDNVRGKGR